MVGAGFDTSLRLDGTAEDTKLASFDWCAERLCFFLGFLTISGNTGSPYTHTSSLPPSAFSLNSASAPRATMSSKAALMRIAIRLRTTALLFVFFFEIMKRILISSFFSFLFLKVIIVEHCFGPSHRSNSGRKSALLGTARSINARQEKRGKAWAFHRVAGCVGSTARAGSYGPVPGKMRGSGEPGVTWRRCKEENGMV